MASDRPLRRRLLRVLPWLIAAIALSWIFHQHPLERVVEEMVHGDVLEVVPWAFLPVMVGWLTITSAELLVLREVVPRPPSWRSLLAVHAGLGLLTTVNYGVGKGSYGVWVARSMGTNAFTATGLVAYFVTSDLAAVCIVATLALALGDVPDVGGVEQVAPALAIVLSVLAVAGPLRILGGRAPRILEPWTRVPSRVAAAQLALRTLQIGLICVSLAMGAGAFGLMLPLAAVVARTPLILIAGSLPINVAGLGAVQAVWVWLFEPWESGPRILAFQFLWLVVLKVAVVTRGLPFVRRTVTEVAASPPSPDEGAG